MPVIDSPTYQGSILSINKHFETIYPALLRKVKDMLPVQRERIELPDGDFIDFDLAKHPSVENNKVVIISHGLEGDSTRPYVRGMMKAFFQNGWDVIAWNFRGCSGEMNRLVRFYNSGATEDLDQMAKEAVKRHYSEIFLVGFSLGGNLTVKFLGEPYALQYPIKAAAAFSVPIHLWGCSREIDKWHNYLYAQRFLRSLVKKVEDKAKVYPSEIDVKGIKKVKTIFHFDDIFTGPLHGYAGAMDYYEKCSSVRFVKNVTVPLLVVNALNDTFLSTECFDEAEFKNHDQAILLKPAYGGHCGFANFGSDQYWSEKVAVSFCAGPEQWIAGRPAIVAQKELALKNKLLI